MGRRRSMEFPLLTMSLVRTKPTLPRLLETLPLVRRRRRRSQRRRRCLEHHDYLGPSHLDHPRVPPALPLLSLALATQQGLCQDRTHITHFLCLLARSPALPQHPQALRDPKSRMYRGGTEGPHRRHFGLAAAIGDVRRLLIPLRQSHRRGRRRRRCRRVQRRGIGLILGAGQAMEMGRAAMGLERGSRVMGRRLGLGGVRRRKIKRMICSLRRDKGRAMRLLVWQAQDG